MLKYYIELKKDAPDHVYTELCNTMERQGVFVSCGSCDNKWILGKWEDELDFAAWCISMGMPVSIEKKEV